MKKTIGIIIMTSLLMKIEAQNLKTYEGSFEKGNAKYTYFENEKGERIYNGNFEYVEKGKAQSIKDIFGQTVMEAATLKQIVGQYKNGKAIGERKRRLYSIGAEGVIDISKMNTSNSKLMEEMTYNYDENGNLSGSYLYVKYDINNNNKIVQKVTANIKNGHLIGHYEKVDYSTSPSLSLIGSFDQDGFFDGEWNYVNTVPDLSTIEKLKLNTKATLKEIRNYKHGVLSTLKLYDNAKGNILYEYSSKAANRSSTSNQISCDSLKLTFNSVLINLRNDKVDYRAGERKYQLYLDYSNIESRELIPSGMSFATEFADLGGFIKVYTYRYHLNAEERILYKKRSDCYGLIDKEGERAKTTNQDVNAQFTRNRELKILDTVFNLMTNEFLKFFDKQQMKLNEETIGNRICFVFNDTLSFVQENLLEIPKQIEHLKKIKTYFNDYYSIAYRKIREGNGVVDRLVKSTKNMPYQGETEMDSKFFREYSTKLQELTDKMYLDIVEARIPILEAIKRGNDSAFLLEIEKSNEKLKNLDTEYETSLANLITWTKISNQQFFIDRMKNSKKEVKK